MSTGERTKLALRQAREVAARHASDCGSSEVQGVLRQPRCARAVCLRKLRTRVFAAPSSEPPRHLLPPSPLTPRRAASVLTKRIAFMTEHLKLHPKDHHSRLGLMGMLASRRRLLQYLRRKDGDTYGALIARLGLRDQKAGSQYR